MQTVKQTADRWHLSERAVRDYCIKGRIAGAVYDKGRWFIPDDVEKPARKKRVDAGSSLSKILLEESRNRRKGGIYHKTQIDFAYNSNHIEGSTLTEDETRYIYETNTAGVEGAVRVDDVIETINHFRCFDYILQTVNKPLTERYIKELHRILKTATLSSERPEAVIGNYKRLPNYIGNIETTPPEEVSGSMHALLEREKKATTLDDLLDFHAKFEQIHPFYDGNGRVGRLILFKQCLKLGIVPFVIHDTNKAYYYRGLKAWQTGGERGYLRDTCLLEQDNYKLTMDYFGIPKAKTADQ